MAVYLINYDLNKETSRPNLAQKIQDRYASWANLSESSYAVKTNETHAQVYAFVSQYCDSDDDIFVIPLSKPYSGYGQKNVIAWLDANLPQY